MGTGDHRFKSDRPDNLLFIMSVKKLILIAGLLFSVTVFLGFFGVVNTGMNTASVFESVVGVSAETNKTKTVNYAVRKGDTFSTVLEEFGFTGEEANKILSQASDIYDFTNIAAGNVFQFTLKNGSVDEVRYDIDNEDQVIIAPSEKGYDISKENIKYTRKQRTAEGTINSSLFIDGRESGLKDKTILEIAEIFAWDVDFAADIRKGDKFAVVYDDLYRNGSYVGPGRIRAAKFINDGEKHFAFYFKNGGEDGKYYDKEGRAVVRQFLKSPLTYARITSGFSYNRLNPVTRSSYGAHRAIDYGAPAGTPIYATGQGRVAYAGWGSGLGLYVKISHGGVYDTVYAHMSGLASGIRNGVSVSQGQVVGYVGSTGYSTGAHLHYEMRKYGRRVNPLTHELPPGEPIKDEYKEEFQDIVDTYKPKLQ